MKQKRANRVDWQRILQKRFVMKHLDTSSFTGYVSLFCIDAVREPLWIQLSGKEICLADKGYLWLQHFPQGAHYAVTTVFDAQGELVRWYIDICKRHYVDEQGMLWYEDLYLDLDVSPDGEPVLLDADELDEALYQGVITPLEYELAWREASSLLTVIEDDTLPLFWLCEEHKEMLLKLV
jgi:predicted RNA-binding protein associated with RNAse of E/G family